MAPANQSQWLARHERLSYARYARHCRKLSRCSCAHPHAQAYSEAILFNGWDESNSKTKHIPSQFRKPLGGLPSEVSKLVFEQCYKKIIENISLTKPIGNKFPDSYFRILYDVEFYDRDFSCLWRLSAQHLFLVNFTKIAIFQFYWIENIPILQQQSLLNFFAS